MPVLLIKSPVYFLSVWIWTNNWWLRLGASKKSQNCIRHWVSRGWMPPRCAAPLPPLLNVTPMLLPCGCEHRFITHNTLGQTQPNQWKPINIAPGLLRRGRGGSVTLCQCWQCWQSAPHPLINTDCLTESDTLTLRPAPPCVWSGRPLSDNTHSVARGETNSEAPSLPYLISARHALCFVDLVLMGIYVLWPRHF